MTPAELRELDAEVHRAVFGRSVEYDRQFAGDWAEVVDGQQSANWPAVVPKYSTDIAAAWAVFEVLSGRYVDDPLGSSCVCQRWSKSQWHVELGGRFESVEATAPLAICRAALKAVEDKPGA